MDNPFYLQDQPGAAQSQGWLDAWTTQGSPYAVEALSAADVAAAVTFASDNSLRLVIKGAGHDYLGRNNAADSFLIWTHKMRDVIVRRDFVPQGSEQTPTTAISVGAGTRWLEAYEAATAADLYVQGGGCTSVGASGGFTQGSGFGSFSKRFGTGSGGVLEFEVVTASGDIVVANQSQNADLFWALRGGGGATFGVVTRTTLLAHPIPGSMGTVSGLISAKSDSAYRRLLRKVADLMPALDNPSWGDLIKFTPENTVELALLFLDLSKAEAESVFTPLQKWVAKQNDIESDLEFRRLPFKDLWNAAAQPDFVTRDTRPNQPANQYWWKGNQGEVSWFIASYHSRWLPESEFTNPQKVADLLFEASRHHWNIVQLNKGLAGEAEEARSRDLTTSLRPSAFDALALILVADAANGVFPGVPGYEPNQDELATKRDQVNSAIRVFREALPESGSYANEADYFEQDWQNEFWGENYPRLLEIKQQWDPFNLFKVHHGVGSEAPGSWEKQ